MTNVIQAFITPKKNTQGKEIILNVFWDTKKKWDDAAIKKYHETVEDNAYDFQHNYRERGSDGSIHKGMLTCEDFSLKLLIKYASSEGLPLKLKTGSGTFRNMEYYTEAHDEFRTSPEGYEDMVMPKYGAPDTLLNATVISFKDLLPGDIMFKNDNKHVQVIMKKTIQEIRIKQGNFVHSESDETYRKNLGRLSKILIGENVAQLPHQKYYLGGEIEDGIYRLEDYGRWSYQNLTLKKHREYETFKQMNKYLRWNFNEFNK